MSMASDQTSPISSGISSDANQYIWTLLLYFLRPRWWLYLAGGVLGFMVSLLEGVSLAVALPLFSSLFGAPQGSHAGGEAVVAWVRRIIALVPVEDAVIGAGIVLLACATAKFLLGLATEYVAAHATGYTLYETRQKVLERYHRLPYAFFLEHRQGDLKHVVLMSTQRVSYCLWMLASATTESFKVVAILGLLMMVNGLVTLVAMVTVLALYFAISIGFQKMVLTQGQQYMIRQMEMTNLADELLAGVKSILLFDVFQRWIDRFATSSLAQMRHQIRQRVVMSMPKSILETGITLGFLGFMVGLYWVHSERVIEFIPLMGLVGMAVMKMGPSLYVINRTRLDLVSQLPDVRLVYNILTWPVVESHTGGIPFSRLQKSVVFDQVVFGYPDKEPVLQRLSMVIEREKVTAVVGRSGEGKTTIINLLLGLYEPHGGAVLVDGESLSRLDLRDWRARIGLVPQDPFLFHGTLAENIAFGDPSFSRQQIEDAGRVALVDEFVQKLPYGYDTIVGDKGLKLSGGQQQRIAIARAILRDPQILVFDEATSSLDALSERLVKEAITRTSRNRTVVVIAHRLSTIQHADKIVVLQQGHSIEEGTHEQLVRGDGPYARLVHAATMPRSVVGEGDNPRS